MIVDHRSDFVMLEFFAYCQQQDADNYNSNKGIGFPGEFFFQENTGKQQRNNTNRRNNRCCNCAVAAQGVHICKLTGGFEYGSQNLVLAQEEVPAGYIESMNQLIATRFEFSAEILRNNYYQYVFGQE